MSTSRTQAVDGNKVRDAVYNAVDQLLADSARISALIALLMTVGCGGGVTTAPGQSLSPATYSTDSAPASQPLIPFARTDSSQCLGLEDATLTFTDAQSLDEVRRYIMPVVSGTRVGPGTQAISFERNHLPYTYDAGSGVLILIRGTVSDTGQVSTISGVSTLKLREHFQTLSSCHESASILVVYHRT